MIKIETIEISGWEAAIRGMRNPMNSWEKSDSGRIEEYINNSSDLIDSSGYFIGPKDMELAMKLVKAGPVHAKFRRMIVVWVDVTAPLYWWKEFDTYKVGTVANSCSTMHKIQEKEFVLDDFSHEKLIFDKDVPDSEYDVDAFDLVNEKYCGLIDTDFVDYNSFPGESFKYTINFLNRARELFLKTKDKKYWWQMIQLLPSSYNQKRTVMLNYEVLSNIYKHRTGHKLDEWIELCKWIENLPCSELITGAREEKGEENE